MNTKHMAEVLADPAALAELQKCTSVCELEACLNEIGAECTREEALRFLRAWENAEADSEIIEMEYERTRARKRGILQYIKRVLQHGRAQRQMAATEPNHCAVTFEQIMKQMNR